MTLPCIFLTNYYPYRVVVTRRQPCIILFPILSSTIARIMKIAGALVICGLAASTFAATPEPSVYTFDSGNRQARKSDPLPSLSLEDTQLFLAHRLGLSKHYSLEYASGDALNLLSGSQGRQTLFSANPGIRRLLLIIQGLEDPKRILPNGAVPSFRLSDADGLNWEKLPSELLDEDAQRRGAVKRCEFQDSKDRRAAVHGGFSSNDVSRCLYLEE